MKVKDLQIPTNPNFNWQVSPTEQLEYVNPVTLNNWAIQLANQALAVSSKIIVTNKHIRAAKQALVDAKASLEDFEYDLLREYPANSSTSKTLKILESHLRRSATAANKADQYQVLREAVRNAQRDYDKYELDLDNARQVSDTIKLMGIHIQTHLSFIKAEKAART